MKPDFILGDDSKQKAGFKGAYPADAGSAPALYS